MTDREIVLSDIETLYLGNLGTVEFDLDLPRTGKLGSQISWESDAPHFLDAEGHVTRPAYGRGNRIVTLTATFAHGDASEQHAYNVQVLEQNSDFVVEHVAPIAVEGVAGEATFLPDAVSATTEDGRTLALRVEWDEGIERTWAEVGSYTAEGAIHGTDCRVTAEVTIAAEAAPRTAAEADILRPIAAQLEGDSDFLAAQERMHAWLLTTDTDQFLYNFRAAAGLDTCGAAPMTGWDSPDGLLRGHTTGHYLSALAKCWRATGDTAIYDRARAMVDGLVACQRGLEAAGCAKGFLSAYDEEQFDKLEVYTPYPKIWAPYYTLHKILAGLLDLFELAGIDEALDLARGIGTWTHERLTRLPHAQLVKMWNIYIAGEYGGMNEALARLARITGDDLFAQTARLFDNDRLFVPLDQDVDALNGMHANQHIPQIVGAMEVYHATGDERYLTRAERFWDELTAHHTYAIGGTGESEMWHAPDHVCDLLTASTCESCASYNLLKLTGMLHEHAPHAAYMDYYERVLFSHTLATCDHDVTGGTTYFISMKPGAVKDIDALENSCCHGTGMEQPSMYADHIYHLGGTDAAPELYVDLFIPSKAAAEDAGITVSQSVDAQLPGTLALSVSAERGATLRVRVPSWCAGEPSVALDGGPVAVETAGGYLTVPLSAGSHAVAVEFPVALRIERAGDDATRYCVFWGPYVLAALSDAEEALELPADAALSLAPSDAPMEFIEDVSGIRFIPFERVHHERYHLYLKDA